jgi:hypothetical protein
MKRWSEGEKFWDLAGLRAFFDLGTGMYGLCLA